VTTLADKLAEFQASITSAGADLDLWTFDFEDVRLAFLCGASAALVCVKEAACAAGTIATTNMALGPVKEELERLEKSGETEVDFGIPGE
jgi:hypothetical protein